MVFGIHFVVFVFRNLSLKFGQNQVSNKGYVADVVIVTVIVVVVVDVVVVLLLIPENIKFRSPIMSVSGPRN